MSSKEVLTECHNWLAHFYVVTWLQQQLGDQSQLLTQRLRGGTDVPVTSGQSSEGAWSQAGWDSEQPDLVKDVPSKAEGLDWNGL